MKRLLLFPILAAFQLGVGLVEAQTPVTVCVQSGPGPSCVPVTVTNPLPVSTGGGTGSTAANQLLEIAALGAPTDPAWVGSGDSTIVAALKAIYGQALTSGTAGSPASQVVTIQGIASMTPLATYAAPQSSATFGITPLVSGSAESSHVLKSAPGNLYGAYAVNLTATAGFLVLVNATSAPADGAITPLACVPLPANGAAAINNKPGPPQVYSAGVTAVVSSAASCFTKTTGVITAYLSGDVQ